jgi:hypothetical protein
MGQVARKAAVATLVVLGLVALALALWKLRVLVSLFFLGLVIAAAMRPGVEYVPTSQQELDRATKHSSGIKHQILRALQKRLKGLPAAGRSSTPR